MKKDLIVSSVINDSFDLIKANLKNILYLLGPLLIVSYFIILLLNRYIPPIFPVSIHSRYFYVVIPWLPYCIVMGAFLHLLSCVQANKKWTLINSFISGAYYGPIFFTSALIIYFLFLFMSFILIKGIGPLTALIIWPALYWFMAKLCLTPIIIYKDERNPVKAFRQSWKMTSGYEWKFIGLLFLISIIANLLSWPFLIVSANISSNKQLLQTLQPIAKIIIFCGYLIPLFFSYQRISSTD